ncbi:MAG TPA: HEAT repeat domain-containing protein [Nitrospirales bacterium]|nr:HEAT repeat domain-containing protein [Nitrospirales bacterium]
MTAGLLDARPASADGARPVILLAGQAATREDLDEPPYNIVIAVKTRLQRVGFDVVLDPAAPYAAVLVLDYRESPGPMYRLESGTRIRCRIDLYNPATAREGPARTYELQAETSSAPLRSLYWDAVQQLEENAYYYFLGELVRGWWVEGVDAVTVLGRVLNEPPALLSSDGADDVVTARVAANQAARTHAIQELGRLRDPRALPTLRTLAHHAPSLERAEAVRALAAIGTTEGWEEVRGLSASEDPRVRAAASDALAAVGK